MLEPRKQGKIQGNTVSESLLHLIGSFLSNKKLKC